MRVRERHLLLGLAALALLLRLEAIRQFGPGRLEFGDAADYLFFAEQLCATGAYPERGSMPFFRAPGLPLFIVALSRCMALDVAIIKVALAVVDASTVIAISLLAKDLWASRRAGAVAGCLAALNPVFITQVRDLQSEPLFMFFMTWGVWLLVRALKEGTPLALPAGISFGSAALTRPVGLVVIVVSSLYLLCATRNRAAFTFLAGAVLTIAPWTLYNYDRFGEVITINDAAGYNLWRGTNPELQRLTATDFWKGAEVFERDVSAPKASQIAASHPTLSARSRAWVDLAIAEAQEQPGAFVRTLLRNAFAYWRPWLNPQAHPPQRVFLSGVLFTTLHLAGFWGLAVLWRESPVVGGFFVLLFISTWLAQIPFQVVLRFRIPIVDPALIALGAGAIVRRKRVGPDRYKLCL